MADNHQPVKVIQFDNGQQCLVTGNPAAITVTLEDVPIIAEASLSVTPEELEDLQVKAASNSVDFDTIKENITTMNENPVTAPAEELTSND